MNEPTLKIKGKEVKFATTLRVAYNIQSALGNKPYMDIFADFDSLNVEDQITIMYESYKLGNKDTTILTKEEFTDFVLDELGVFEMSLLIAEVIAGITYGKLTDKELEAKKARAQKMRERDQFLG